jgi:L-glyceraldehyde 3-phosphate reductase
MPYLASETRYDAMTYKRTGHSGLKLPLISLGFWYNFGGLDAFENGRAMARRAFDLGVTHFDLANNYGPPPGSAEETFGQLMRLDFHPYRDELIISTKAGYDMWPGPYGEWGSRKYMLASLDQSLKRMGLEYVDIFYSHRPDRWKKPCPRWMRLCAREKPSTWGFHPTRRSKPRKRRRSCVNWARPA